MSRTRKICFVMAALFVLAIAMFIGVERLRGKRALARWIQETRKNGGAIMVSEALPPPVLPKDNAAVALLAASRKAGAGFMDKPRPGAAMLVAPDKAGVSTKMSKWPESVGKAPPRDIWPEFEKTVAESEAALTLVYQAMEREQLDFGLDYAQGFDLLLPHLVELKRLCSFLAYHAQNDLHRGSSDRAFKHLELGLRLVRMQTPEYLIISQLVRIAQAHIVWNVCWEGLQHHQWSDAQLAALQAAWESVEFAEPMERSFSLERSMNLMMFEKLRHSASEVLKVIAAKKATPFSMPPTAAPVNWSGDIADIFLQVKDAFPSKMIEIGNRAFYVPLWQVAWSHQDEARFARLYDQYVERVHALKERGHIDRFGTSDQIEDDVVSFVGSADENAGSVYDRARFLLSDFIGSSQDRSVDKVVRMEAIKQLTITAIALERHRLAKGSLPDKLTDLIPTWLSKLPMDPMDGETLRYQKTENDEFLLYSIGTDGKDDQGDARRPGEEGSRRTSFTPWSGKDWVWPRVASEDEVLEFLRSRKN